MLAITIWYLLIFISFLVDVAEGRFCEATIGCPDEKTGNLILEIVQTEFFRLKVVSDADCVELCAALKVFYFK